MPLVNAVLYGADDVVGAHVQSRLPGFSLQRSQDGARLYAALGVARPRADGERQLLGGVVFDNLHAVNGKPICIEVHVAFDHAGWIGRDTLRQLFGYPFIQLGCATMVARVRRSNKRSRKLCMGVGFQLVGPIPRAFDGREDVMLYAMTKDSCRWLKERNNGQV